MAQQHNDFLGGLAHALGSFGAPVARGAANFAAGVGAMPVTGLYEALNRGVASPLVATAQSAGDLMHGQMPNWMGHYNQNADAVTGQFYNDIHGLDQRFGTNMNDAMSNAYAHPGQTAAFTGLGLAAPWAAGAAKAAPALAPVAKYGSQAMGLGFGGYALSQLPGEISQFNHAPDLQSKIQLGTEGALNTGFGVLGMAHGAPLVPEATKGAYKGGKYVKDQGEMAVYRNADKLANASVAVAQNPSLPALAGAHPAAVAGIPTAGYQAGARSARAARATDQGLSREGIDGEIRIPVSNQGAKLNAGPATGLLDHNRPTTLREILPHKEFEKDYKDLRDVPVLAAENPQGVKAVYDPARRAILVDPAQMPRDPEKIGKILLHEREHAIQHYEGRSQGTMPGAVKDPGLIDMSPDMQALHRDIFRLEGQKMAHDNRFEAARDAIPSGAGQLDKKAYAASVSKVHQKFRGRDYDELNRQIEDLKYQFEELRREAAKDPARIAKAQTYDHNFAEAEARAEETNFGPQKELDHQTLTGDYDPYHGLDPKAAEASISFKPQMAASAEKPKPSPVKAKETPDIRYAERGTTVRHAGETFTVAKKPFTVSGQTHVTLRSADGRVYSANVRGLEDNPTVPVKNSAGHVDGKPNQDVFNHEQRLAYLAQHPAPEAKTPIKASEITPPTPEPQGPKPLGEQIGRLKAAIAKETDPNTKAELAKQLATLKKRYSTEKQAGTSDPDAIAKAMGITPDQQDQLIGAAEAKGKGREEKDATIAQNEQKVRDNAARVKAVAEPTRNKVDLEPGEGGVKAAIANSQHVSYTLNRKATAAHRAAQGLTKESRVLADQYEYGQPIDAVASQAKGEKQQERLAKALTALEDYYDFKLAAERAAGAQVPKVGNYGRHFWDLADPKDQERFDQFAKQQGITQFHGTSSQPRVFRTYEEGERAGFKRQNPNDIFKDLVQDANMSTSRVERAALKEGLVRAGGESVSTEGMGRDKDGKPFVNSNIRGLEGLSYTKEIADQLKGYNQLDRNIFGKSWDKLNSFQKNIQLSLSLFHSLNISGNFAGTHVWDHPVTTVKGLGQSTLAMVSPRYAEHVMRGFEERGVTEWAGKNGVSLGSNHDINPEGWQAKIGGSRINPITQGHKAIFEREIPIMALHMAEIGKRSGIEAGSPEGIKYGEEVNNIMGLLNQKLLSRDPNHQKWLNRAMLAPAFTETKYRALGDAFFKWGGQNQKAGNLARQAVVGKTALFGIVGILGSILATGQFPTVQQALSQFTDPNVETKIKNKAGGTKAAYLPHTFLSEPLDPLLKLAHGDTSGVIHYANARLSPNASTANKLLTNQDYFGNPIYDPDKPVAKQIAGQVLKQGSPIGIQNATDAAMGRKGMAETALNEAGFRVKNDPHNPVNAQTNAFFQARDEAMRHMSANQKADFDSINPKTKNPDGSYTPEASFNPFKSPQKVLTLLKDPEVLSATVKINQAQSNHDPMWDLPSDQLKTFLTYQAIQGTDYESATAKEIKTSNPWITDLNQERSKWFNTLPPTKNPDALNPLKYPEPSARVQQAMDTYQSISDPKARAAFMKANPELASQFDAMNKYTQDRRQQQGVPEFAQAPKATSYVQGQMDAGNFRDPLVQQYLNANNAFKIAGPFGDGISGGGGNRNTSAEAIANVEAGLKANGQSQQSAKRAFVKRGPRPHVTNRVAHVKTPKVGKVPKSHLEAALLKAHRHVA